MLILLRISLSLFLGGGAALTLAAALQGERIVGAIGCLIIVLASGFIYIGELVKEHQKWLAISREKELTNWKNELRGRL